ncbi:MAG: hypothetical protein JWN77_1556 [Frankiales bacterium]|jgi:chromate reductase|nr:hypothetical protein [Frankiales bacterium]
MNVLVLTGSARSGSYTRALGQQIAAATGGALAGSLTELPYFDQDLEPTPPAVVEELRAQVAAADALVVVTPEYNGTISGLLGNAIDWLSRPYAGGPAALEGKPVAAVAASPGAVGGVRALVSLRTVLGNAGAQLLDTTVSVGEVHSRLEDGELELAELVEALATPVLQAA